VPIASQKKTLIMVKRESCLGDFESGQPLQLIEQCSGFENSKIITIVDLVVVGAAWC
jgi:hypothetical protein